MTDAMLRLTPQLVFAAWCGVTRSELRTTFLLGCALWLLVMLYGIPLRPGPGFFTALFVAQQIKAFAILLAVLVADRLTGKDPDRRIAYAIAIAVGAAVGALAAVAWMIAMSAALGRSVGLAEAGGALRMRTLEMLIFGAATIWARNESWRTRSARARMHAAELERIDAEKRSIESDLQAMQARVEPQFLFNTLAQVRDLYRSSAERGENMLDELIAYLRAAMPKMRDTSSTVGQELDLVRAYLAIVRLRLGERLAFEIESPTGLADARMPPLMLLPLVDHAIAHGLAASRATGSIRIRAAVADGKVRLEIADSGVGFLPGNEGQAIGGIRERLAALFRSDANLALHEREGTATEAVMEIPLEETRG